MKKKTMYLMPLKINGRYARDAAAFIAESPVLATLYRQPSEDNLTPLVNHLHASMYDAPLTDNLVSTHYTRHSTLDSVARELGVTRSHDRLLTGDTEILPYLLRETYGEELGDIIWGNIFLLTRQHEAERIYWLWIPPEIDQAITAKRGTTHVHPCRELMPHVFRDLFSHGQNSGRIQETQTIP